MKTVKKSLSHILVLGLLVFGFSQGWGQSPAGSRAPVITHWFAVDRGYYGDVWRLYLEAEDPDEDMLRIAVTADQAGFGHYHTNWIYLKPEQRGRVRGYLQWNTFSSRAPYIPEWTRILVKVSIFDRAGNESNEVQFPFTFESGRRGQASLPSPFDQGNIPRLGYIHIDLETPYRGVDWREEIWPRRR